MDLNNTNLTNNGIDIITLNDLRAQFLLPNTVVLSVYLVVGVIGNFLVFYVYKFCMSRHRSDRFFIPYLAVCDALSCIIGSGFAISLNMRPIRFSGDALCKGVWFMTKWSTVVSALMLLLIAVDRYKKVCRPFKNQMTPLAKQVSMVTIFVVSAVVTFPTIFFHGEIQFSARGAPHLTGHMCGRNSLFTGLETYFTVYNGVLASLAFIGITTVTILYYFVGKTIYKQTKFRNRFTSSPRKSFVPANLPKSDSGVVSDGNDDVFVDNSTKEESDNKKRKDSSESFYSTDDDLEDSSIPVAIRENGRRKKSIVNQVLSVQQTLKKYKISILFMLITVVFVLTFTPRLAIMIQEAANKEFWTGLSDNQIRLTLFFYRFYIVNNIVNPFLYAAFDPRFTREIKKRIPCFKEASV
ncbi:cholecystokinin receptor type A-like [Saccostrea echinata]|uniref:cholecystokinin receptor type A-like n=1 Tax=Saccostrea echinata TaxID=191078 RepID=UPI002A82EAB8|nr:cholecystokinin receptor type A-like [Saccostrea echinata]